MNDDLVKDLMKFSAGAGSPRCELMVDAATRIRELELQLKQANDAGFNEGVEAAACVVPLIYQKAISQLKRT